MEFQGRFPAAEPNPALQRSRRRGALSVEWRSLSAALAAELYRSAAEEVQLPFPLEFGCVKQAEERLGRALPLGYVIRMCRDNGGEIDVGNDTFDLYPILDTTDRKRLARTCNDIVRETAAARDLRNFPPGALAIGGNGGGDILVFIPDPKTTQFSNAVFWWDHETGELESVADAFDDLL